MRLKKTLVSMMAAGMLAIGGGAMVLAQESEDTVPVKVEVGAPENAGIHWTIVETADFPPVTSNLETAQTTTGQMSVTVTDNRFTSAGWEISISAEDFEGQSTSDVIPVSNFTVTPGAVSVLAGTSEPLPVANALTLSPDGQVLFSADPGSGSGRYSVSLRGDVTIPANTPADSYQTTITVELNAAP